MAPLIFLTVFLVAACGLVYELVAGALASYLLGDSVFQFSTVIGAYLFAMGVGSWLSRFVVRGLAFRFIVIELLTGVVGGFSAALLFLAFAYTDAFSLVLYVLVVVVGILVGIEIPLLMRILRPRFEFRDVVAHVLTFDYIGALAASLLFPILLVPHLGLVRSALAFGLVNAAVALAATWLFRDELRRPGLLRGASAVALAVLAGGVVLAPRAVDLAEENLYADEVILARQTAYQRIVVTRWRDDVRLFLNAHLQFSSRDEYRYHEALVHPGLAALPDPRRVLILGGGDGMAAREVLRHRSVASVTLVDLDAGMTGLFAEHPLLRGLNDGALADPRVRVVNADAFRWLEEAPADELFDFVVIDLPDPNNYALGKLYTAPFYRLAARRLVPQGFLAVQGTSPLFARRSFWTIVATLERAGLATHPYHAYVPSFGEWGFVLAGRAPYAAPSRLPGGLRFLTPETVPDLFLFPPDMQRVAVEPNRLDDQVLVRTYDDEWRTINR